jgi:hypothetical protein
MNTVREFPPLLSPTLQRVPRMEEPEYRAPDWPTVRVRVLRPFRWRAVKHLRNGTTEPLGEPFTTAVGQVLNDVIEPDARSLIALGWAEETK